ncbi:hypothetical protein CFter6_1927 [Collimonas fungivorans]|uniref:Uncharacterized protein n=1 Tax=Collimonas fungivorans TaxID=158899 RepID=A0A127P9X7_9BURK|nr:hypothetical protein CFter6_1927 [Collimonas fungivorans]
MQSCHRGRPASIKHSQAMCTLRNQALSKGLEESAESI